MQQVKYIGITFPDVLFFLFLGLKLAGFINWSWIWVFTPLIAPYVLDFIIKVYRNHKQLKALKNRQ